MDSITLHDVTATLHAGARLFGPGFWLLLALIAGECLDLVSFRRLNALGITPRTAGGLPGIVLSPLLHVDLAHFLANLVPLALLSFVLGKLMPGNFGWIVAAIAGGSGLLVWLAGRNCVHVGASGLVYGLFGFLTLHGFLAGNVLHMALSLLLLVLYSGFLWGVLPTAARTSWESHLAGLAVGAGLAWWRVF